MLINRKSKIVTIAMAALAVQFLAGCFSYKKEEVVQPAPTVVTAPAPVTSETTTTTTTEGTVKRSPY